jgi:large subunit ribosomal protein L35e
VTNGTASKLGKIRMARKNIARVLTVLNHQSRSRMRAEIAKAGNGHGLKRIPKQLRVKKTRAIRRQLTAEQLSKKTRKATHKSQNFALRRFAIQA